MGENDVALIICFGDQFEALNFLFLDAESAELMSKNRERNVRCLIFQPAVMSQDLHMVEKQVPWLSKRVNFLGYLITAHWKSQR